jgi:hypothetical protein
MKCVQDVGHVHTHWQEAYEPAYEELFAGDDTPTRKPVYKSQQPNKIEENRRQPANWAGPLETPCVSVH